MKNQDSPIRSIILASIFFFYIYSSVTAETETEEYAAVHKKNELSALYTQIKEYLDKNGQKALAFMDESRNRIITQSLIRSWSILQHEVPAEKQIDDAYDSLFNMSIFVKLTVDPKESVSGGKLLEYAIQTLDPEYFDLLKESGENPEKIRHAEYLRAAADRLINAPDEFSADEVKKLMHEILQETIVAAGLKSIVHTEKLPKPDDLFTEKQNGVILPNPTETHDSVRPLNEMLGIHMPELTDKFGAQLGYYSIVAEVIAEIEYEFPAGGKLIFRLSPEVGIDISGVYKASLYESLEIAETPVQIYKYQTIVIACGIVKTQNEKAYSYAVDAEGLTEELFTRIVQFFIEECRRQQSAK